MGCNYLCKNYIQWEHVSPVILIQLTNWIEKLLQKCAFKIRLQRRNNPVRNCQIQSYNLCMKILQEMDKALHLEKLGTVRMKSAVKN